MSIHPHDSSQFDGCTGTCNQGRRSCDCREYPAVRPTQPGDLLPVSADPAEGVSGFWVGLGLVGAIAMAVACWHGVARYFAESAS